MLEISDLNFEILSDDLIPIEGLLQILAPGKQKLYLETFRDISLQVGSLMLNIGRRKF